MSKTIDYLIIGQGLAGSVMALELEKRGLNYLVLDGYSEPSSTAVAAGLINPITGRKFVKSWRADEFIPYAKMIYREMGDLLGVTFFSDIEIKRYFGGQKEVNDWMLLQSDPVYENYVGKVFEENNSKIISPFGYGLINEGGWLNCLDFLVAVKGYLKLTDKIIEQNFDHEKLNLIQSNYDGQSFGHIIFCEGYRRISNPLFSFIPETFAKGEVLIVECPDLKSLAVLNKNFIVLPLGNDRYKIGATFSWTDCDFKPTEKGKESLLKKLDGLIRADYTIVDHLVGIRPTSKDRRPILGRHPKYNNVSVFNGLGTKGVSLAPLCASLLCDELLGEGIIDQELSVKRFLE